MHTIEDEEDARSEKENHGDNSENIRPIDNEAFRKDESTEDRHTNQRKDDWIKNIDIAQSEKSNASLTTKSQDQSGDDERKVWLSNTIGDVALLIMSEFFAKD